MKILKLFLVLTFICGVAYPLSVTIIGQSLFPHKSQGSLIIKDGKVIGSELLAQKFSEPGYFHARPSATNYETIPSGASQLSLTSKALLDLARERRSKSPEAGSDAWTASGSGLDPHISPKTALAQIPRIAAARAVSEANIKKLVEANTERQTWGIWGQPRVNVLRLNLDLMSVGTNGESR